MTDITELAQQELAQLRAELSNQAIGSKDHLRKIALSLVDKLEKCRDREIRWLALSDEKSKIITDQEEALEKAQQVDEELCKLLPPGAEYMDPPDGGDVTPLEQVSRMVADYRQRISMLESKIVIVSLPSINPEMFNQDVVFGYQKAQKEAVEFCAAAGIKLQVGK
ncbi:hypothetical protein WDT62_01160 [Klebsiella pneumoniae]|uniref:hypothetical protein n=1 Tax=Klebsiella TaxID=570 RepID=UPI00044EAF7B|nr:hypothetical protein [Klebsiella pneumoniae]EWF78679.1 hypothetical protein L381_00318 [Klebsiella pneumoniae MGH 35]KMG75981.1 hypothetical protein SM59_00312 [Klebsiella pneumoniae]KMH04935.1 hypothetical protein SM63_00976 [Klebsiella pneumoniae]MCA6673079.1 hypothetical protein [Klebsiella pneumoniae]MCD5681313.1 hypothetical protein [Klebsiella pneumoniae]